MASCAEGDQILLGIIPRLTAKLFVVSSRLDIGAARWASPAVSAEHLVAKVVVQVRIQAQMCALVRASSRSFLGCVIKKRLFFLRPKELEQPKD